MRYFREMRRLWLGLSVAAVVFSFSSAADGKMLGWNGRVFDVSRQAFLRPEEIRAGLSGIEVLVLGEKHNTVVVQLEEARAIAEALEANPRFVGRWVLGWEFLNRRDQKSIEGLWSRYLNSEVTVKELMEALLGKDREQSYIPILEAGARYRGQLRGLNLSRDEKAPVVKGGLGALDPALIPPGFAMGGAGYRERFDEAMGSGHATPDQLERYFQAQCLVDDVMAHTLLEGNSDLRVLVNGSFHSDYHDGAVARIRARETWVQMKTIRFIDASDYSEADLSPQLNLRETIWDPKYGVLADWIWFAGEPSSN